MAFSLDAVGYCSLMKACFPVLLAAAASCAVDRVPEPAPEAVRPFRIHVDERVLADLRERLDRTRFPAAVEGTGWEMGVRPEYMKDLVEHWRLRYDWREAERALNRLDHFVTRVDGIDLHFIHQRSKHANALPILLSHGWPGSIAEFLDVIGPLTDPEAHGGKAEDAFHVICPSLPGYGFSGRPMDRGWTPDRIAEAFLVVMDRLGYPRFGAQGGDWGRSITERVGSDPRVVGIHLQFPPGSPPQGQDPKAGITPEEHERWVRRREELKDHYAYGAIQGTRPLTLGYGLNDSPAGLAAWIVDKFWAWSDHGGNLDSKFSKDKLLTNIMLYWVTETMPSSTRIYYEYGHPVPAKPVARARRTDRVPVGVALFPKEIHRPARAWVERSYRLVHWTEMPRGGHFAALEEPGLWVDDVRAFFRPLR
jgi:pimeloyl-ACP methyl ester carboxylesterase